MTETGGSTPCFFEVLLASGSPRRFEILAAHGIGAAIVAPELDESLPPDIGSRDPEAIVRYLARAKALDVAGRVGSCGAGGSALPGILIAADTVVYLDRVIGKPADEAEAFEILASYRRRSHEVWTGVCIIDRESGAEDTFAVCTRVTMGDYTDDEIRRYIKEERPFDKAGAYAIQSEWGRHVTSLKGDYENVIGFPWPVIKEHLTPLIKAKAKRILPPLTYEWAQKMGVSPAKVSIGNARKRWGSCNSKGNIRLTWRIILGTREEIDYLIVHELAHLKHLNHSRQYWEEVNKVMPDHKKRRKNLRELYIRIEAEAWL
jgi:septum formation protein